MAVVTGASLQPIYERLNGAPKYHPMDAKTFADPSLEAGDVVTVVRNGVAYSAPVHTSKIVWKKSTEVQISAGGNEKRPALPVMSGRKYGRGGRTAIRNSEYLHYFVEDQYHQLSAGLELTLSSARLYVDNKYTQMQAGLQLTSSAAMLYTQNRTTRAYIMTRINADNEGEALIEADKVKITGDVTVNGTMEITDNKLAVKKSAVFRGNVSLTTDGAYVQAPNFTLARGGRIRLNGATDGEYYDLTATNIQGIIKSAHIDQETGALVLTPFHGSAINFNRAAATLSGAWGSGKFTVTASSGATYDINFPETTVTDNNTYIVTTADGNKSFILSTFGNDAVDLRTLVNGTYVSVARISHNKYTAGWNAAYGKVSIPSSANTSSTIMRIGTPPSTVGGAAEETKFYVTVDADHGYIRKGGSNGTIMAQCTNPYSNMNGLNKMYFQMPGNQPSATFYVYAVANDGDTDHVTVSLTLGGGAFCARSYSSSGTVYGQIPMPDIGNIYNSTSAESSYDGTIYISKSSPPDHCYFTLGGRTYKLRTFVY